MKTDDAYVRHVAESRIRVGFAYSRIIGWAVLALPFGWLRRMGDWAGEWEGAFMWRCDIWQRKIDLHFKRTPGGPDA